MKIYPNLLKAIEGSKDFLINTGKTVMAKSWQGTKSPAPMFEALDLAFKCPIPSKEQLLAEQTKCNLPWAEEHFKERVSGIPYNPPPSHENWPFGVSNNSEFTQGGIFDHTYTERFWPKRACTVPSNRAAADKMGAPNNKGIRFEYGDLDDVIQQLIKDPLTRQAYLPIFFPEDTGAKGGKGRVPCTLGYHFIQRDGFLHCTYFMRSCDYNRHFRDDLYMAGRLMQHICFHLTDEEERDWVRPGMLKFYATSFHVFDYERVKL